MEMEVNKMRSERGFTLIEMMVTVVIAMVLLAGLLLAFQSQYGEYKYQNKRVDAAQDLELGIRFMADDLRLALRGTEVITITNNASSPNETTDLVFKVWSEDTTLEWGSLSDAQAQKFKAVRHYQYDRANRSLKYDRNTFGGDSPVEMLPNVTYFKVFTDTAGVTPSGYEGAPPGLPATTVINENGDIISVSGYTILIEMSVNAAAKNAQKKDVRGNATTGTDRRIWRYVQIYPMAAI